MANLPTDSKNKAKALANFIEKFPEILHAFEDIKQSDIYTQKIYSSLAKNSNGILSNKEIKTFRKHLEGVVDAFTADIFDEMYVDGWIEIYIDNMLLDYDVGKEQLETEVFDTIWIWLVEDLQLWNGILTGFLPNGKVSSQRMFKLLEKQYDEALNYWIKEYWKEVL